MIVGLKILLLEILQGYFTSSRAWAIPAILLIVYLFILQFSKQNKNPLPGIAAIIIIALEFIHIFNPEAAGEWFAELIQSASTPRADHLSEIPVFEFIFRIFVGPIEYRTGFDELIFVGLLAYLFFFIRKCYKDYKSTKKTVSSFDPYQDTCYKDYKSTK